MAKGDKLTLKQELFIAEYIKCQNASEAARLAGYSEKTAKEIGFRLMNTPAIKSQIDEHFGKKAAKISVDADYVLMGIKSIAENGERDGDRLKAYELLGKHLKLFTEKTEVVGKDGGAVQVEHSGSVEVYAPKMLLPDNKRG